MAELGFQVVSSPWTNQELLELGLASCVDCACLPLKAYVGHVQFLVQQGLSLLFVPQVVSLFPKEWTCSVLLGLPDLVKQYVPPSVRLLTPVLDARWGIHQLTLQYLHFGLQWARPSPVLRAWRKAVRAQRTWERAYQAVSSPGRFRLLLLGPRYLTDDPYLNGNLREKLRDLGAEVLCPADFSDATTAAACSLLRKRPYWTCTRRSLGALAHAVPQLDGVVTISPFGCGAEAMQGVLITSLTGTRIPHLELHVDEHTSPVGLFTRLEAFCDLLERKRSG